MTFHNLKQIYILFTLGTKPKIIWFLNLAIISICSFAKEQSRDGKLINSALFNLFSDVANLKTFNYIQMIGQTKINKAANVNIVRRYRR